MRRRTLAINLLSIDGGQLSGIGYYGVALFEQMLDLLADADVDPIAFVRRGAERHFSAEARSKLISLPFDGGRVKRVLFEQLLFPFHLMSKQVDILINPAFTGPLWGARKRVTVVHDMYFKVIPEMLERYQRIYLNLFVPLNCRLSWKILTDSNSSANDLVRFYPDLKDRVAAVALASRFEGREAAERREAPDPAGEPYILMVANLTANKNPAAAVRAVSILRDRGRPLTLVHVGADRQGLLAAAVEANDAGGWTRSLRNLDDAELLALYRGALCLVVPSFYEGFGLPVLEGQQAGVPVVCSNRSSLPEVGGDAALYFDPDQPAELADRLAEISDDATLRSELIGRGYENAARYSWRKTAENVLRHLELLD